jgi:hypothetical protein
VKPAKLGAYAGLYGRNVYWAARVASIIHRWYLQRGQPRVHPLSRPVQLLNAAFWRVGDHRHEAGGRGLELDLLRDIQSVIHLNPEISDGALQLRMAEEELHSAQVASLTIDLGSLRAPHRVRAIRGRL